MWGEAPPRKPNFQASKLPNFLISFGAGKWGAGGRTIVRPALAPHLSCKICVFADSFSPDKIAWQLRFHHCGILPRDMKQEQASELVWQMSETFRVGALLACVGGFLDAYTFLCRGGVFANAQTGNLALLGTRLAVGDWAGACGYLFPVLAFILGVLLAEGARRLPWGGSLFHWRQPLLLVEAAVLALCVCCPGLGDAMVNMAISFVCAIQVQGFRKIHGSPIATTMCTGNLRSAIEAALAWRRGTDPAALRRGLHTLGATACFVLGAAIGAIAVLRFEHWALCVPIGGLLLVCLLLMRRPA